MIISYWWWILTTQIICPRFDVVDEAPFFCTLWCICVLVGTSHISWICLYDIQFTCSCLHSASPLPLITRIFIKDFFPLVSDRTECCSTTTRGEINWKSPLLALGEKPQQKYLGREIYHLEAPLLLWLPKPPQQESFQEKSILICNNPRRMGGRRNNERKEKSDEQRIERQTLQKHWDWHSCIAPGALIWREHTL